MTESLAISDVPFVLNILVFELFDRANDSFMSDELFLKIERDAVLGVRAIV